MRALTLTQPWASLVAASAKLIETRSWRTSYRDDLAIHAAKGFPRECRELCEQEPFRSCLAAAGFNGLRGCDLPRGAVLAVVTLTDCRSTTWSRADDPRRALAGWVYELAEQEEAFGDFSTCRFGWFFENVRPLPEPVPAVGGLGLWEWMPGRDSPSVGTFPIALQGELF